MIYKLLNTNSEDKEKVDDSIDWCLDNIKKEDYENRWEYQDFVENKEVNCWKQYKEIFNYFDKCEYDKTKTYNEDQ